jgi:hypothetical protein
VRRPFRRTRDGIAVRLDEQERRVVRLARDVVDGVGTDDGDPAIARLSYDARPDDGEASQRFRELTAGDLDEARRIDREAFLRTIDAQVITDDEAEAWMRVIGDARLALAARIGITDDGWEAGVGPGQPPELLLVSYLGGIQDALVRVLMG